MPDTEEEDSAAERFWPEGYKQVVRQDVRQLIGVRLNDGKRLRHVYQQRYAEKFTNINQFANRIADMVAIGAENGADDAFDEIIDCFITESLLPEVRRYASYFWPQAFSKQVKKGLEEIIVSEYSQDEVYSYAYEVGYGYNAENNITRGTFHNLDEFISQVVQLVVTGAMNGADDMLEAIYGSFVSTRPLPPARRYPRRLKLWSMKLEAFYEEYE